MGVRSGGSQFATFEALRDNKKENCNGITNATRDAGGRRSFWAQTRQMESKDGAVYFCDKKWRLDYKLGRNKKNA